MKTRVIFMVSAVLLSLAMIVQISCKKDAAGDDDTPEPNKPPTCNITYPGNGTEINKGTIVTVTATANDQDGSVSTVRFYLDGSERGSDATTPYTMSWNTANEIVGNHTLRATAYDDQTAYGSDEISVMIKDTTSNPAPVAAFSADITSGEPHLTVVFTDESLNDPTLWKWSFGDDVTSAEQNPSHTYDKEGIYTVSLEVTNTHGSDTETKTDYINIAIVVTHGSFTDPRDGQEYGTITLGGQTWFAKNLNYETENSWWYNHSAAYGELYGRLYNWEAAMIACPQGWHLPTDDEFKDFEMYIGMSPGYVNYTGYRGTYEGKKMKSTAGWFEEGNGTNYTGFNGLGGGAKYTETQFIDASKEGVFWTATESSTNAAWIRKLKYSEDRLGRYGTSLHYGFSVRCIQD